MRWTVSAPVWSWWHMYRRTNSIYHAGFGRNMSVLVSVPTHSLSLVISNCNAYSFCDLSFIFVRLEREQSTVWKSNGRWQWRRYCQQSRKWWARTWQQIVDIANNTGSNNNECGRWMVRQQKQKLKLQTLEAKRVNQQQQRSSYWHSRTTETINVRYVQGRITATVWLSKNTKAVG